jgi:Fe2+ transport system protein FeoA
MSPTTGLAAEARGAFRARWRRGWRRGPPAGCCSLCALRIGQPATIDALSSDDASQVHYLATLGLLPQANIQVEERAPFDGPLLVTVGGACYALGRDVADGIMVTPTQTEG